jgi:cytochrome c
MRILPTLIIVSGLFLQACNEPEPKEQPRAAVKSEADYIRAIPGKNDSIPAEVSNRGEVLIAYSDCRTCHTVDERFKGPAFKDIARRYPVNDGYINMLAARVIAGGSGAWGYSVMSPHPNLSVEDAKVMVKYILSLKN